MACPVLGGARFWAAAVFLALASFGTQVYGAGGQTTQSASQCSIPGSISDAGNVPESSQKVVREFQRRLEAGPFYIELQRRLGKPKSCSLKLKLDGDTIALSYVFRHHARLSARTNPTIEYSQQRAELRGLSREDSIALLKKAEAASYGQDGCGINWTHSEDEATDDPPKSHATVFRGDSCNCQARIVYLGTSVVGLVLSSSC
jgi:hypothetical protein